jgi:hypothetical protein
VHEDVNMWRRGVSLELARVSESSRELEMVGDSGDRTFCEIGVADAVEIVFKRTGGWGWTQERGIRCTRA